MNVRSQYQPLGVVVRYTRYETDNPAHRVDLMTAYLNVEEAEREAARLNTVARDPQLVSYFVKIAKFIPQGQNSELPTE